MTLEERERLAYISGDLKLAKILGEMMDYESDLDEYSLNIAREKGCEEGYEEGYEDGYEKGLGDAK